MLAEWSSKKMFVPLKTLKCQDIKSSGMIKHGQGPEYHVQRKREVLKENSSIVKMQ